MIEQITRKISKWPFLVADVCLLALAAYILLYRSAAHLELWQTGVCLVAVALGAWLMLLPFLKDYDAALKMIEVSELSTAVGQLKNIEQVKTQIANSTSQWQFIQDESKQTVNAAKEMADRMKKDVREICAFLEKANDTEKTHLRLEVEKLRRSEGDWLQVVVRILDHIYALNQAASRSGQPGLIAQMNQFQHACRDATRRVGLVAFAPSRHDGFDAKMHQLADEKAEAHDDAQITDTLATGYSYQGHLIRKALVTLQPENQPELPLMSSAPDADSPSESAPAALQESNAETSPEPVGA